MDESSESIMDFLRDPLCTLTTLLLNGADVDDGMYMYIYDTFI
jgi:hypothetical protein